MTPFSLTIMHQCVGSALLELPSLPEGPGAAELRLISSFAGVVLALESPYSISSSSSTVLLHIKQQSAHMLVLMTECEGFTMEVMGIFTWGPGWWSLLQTDPWWCCPVWQSSSLCFLWWTCRSRLGTHTAWSRAIAVIGDAGLAEVITAFMVSEVQFPIQSQANLHFDQQGADLSNKTLSLLTVEICGFCRASRCVFPMYESVFSTNMVTTPSAVMITT